MRFLWGWQEVCSDSVVDLDDSLDQGFLDLLDLLVEPFEEMIDNLSEDIGNGLVIKLSVGKHVEMPCESCSNLCPSSPWWP